MRQLFCQILMTSSRLGMLILRIKRSFASSEVPSSGTLSLLLNSITNDIASLYHTKRSFHREFVIDFYSVWGTWSIFFILLFFFLDAGLKECVPCSFLGSPPVPLAEIHSESNLRWSFWVFPTSIKP